MPSIKSALEKMTDKQITGELASLYKQIGRTSMLSEDQSRIQMYTLLEIQYPDKYRPKLPYIDQKELNANILQTKKILNPNAEMSSNYGAISSKISQISGGQHSASNPAITKDRAPRSVVIRN